MKKSILNYLKAALLCMTTVLLTSAFQVHAAESVTISIDAADENEGLQYALDSDEPESFGSSNEFTVEPGSTHIIYVKDTAGNITSQEYTAEKIKEDVISDDSQKDIKNSNKDIHINMEIGDKEYKKNTYENYEYLTDTPIESGAGTVVSKITTDGSNTAEKIFYTITADSGETFYMVIDQGQSENNVYFLNAVTLNDLAALAVDDDKKEENPKEDNLLNLLNEEQEKETTTQPVAKTKNGSSSDRSNQMIFFIFLVLGGVGYYYLKVYKNKKNEAMDMMDAMDMDEFTVEAPEEEVDFETDEKEKEEYFNKLIYEDNKVEGELLDMQPEDYENEEPDFYATSHKDDEEDDDPTIYEEQGDDEEL